MNSYILTLFAIVIINSIFLFILFLELALNTSPKSIDYTHINKNYKPTKTDTSVRHLNIINNRYNSNRNSKMVGKSKMTKKDSSSSTGDHTSDILSVNGTSFVQRGAFGKL